MATIDASKLEKMSVAEREAVKRQIDEAEEQLKNPEQLDAAGQNGVSEMKADIENKKRLLAKDDSLVAQGAEKDRIVARMKQIQAIIVPDMCTMNEMWAKSGTMESDMAVRKNMAFQRKHGKLAQEWQILAKRLEPHDPWAQSLDRIRPK